MRIGTRFHATIFIFVVRAKVFHGISEKPGFRNTVFCPNYISFPNIVALIIPIAYAYRDALLYRIPLGIFNYLVK